MLRSTHSAQIPQHWPTWTHPTHTHTHCQTHSSKISNRTIPFPDTTTTIQTHTHTHTHKQTTLLLPQHPEVTLIAAEQRLGRCAQQRPGGWTVDLCSWILMKGKATNYKGFNSREAEKVTSLKQVFGGKYRTKRHFQSCVVAGTTFSCTIKICDFFSLHNIIL